jgi:hypothetical protein
VKRPPTFWVENIYRTSRQVASPGCWKEKPLCDGENHETTTFTLMMMPRTLHSEGVIGLGNGYRLLREALIVIPMD